MKKLALTTATALVALISLSGCAGEGSGLWRDAGPGAGAGSHQLAQ